MLQAVEITKYFGAEAVLEGVALELNPNERVALVGPNGAGKSTLLRILLGELEPDSGRVHLVPGCSIAYLPQDAGCEPGRTLHEEMLALFENVVALEGEQRRLEELMHGLDPNSPELMPLVEAHAKLHDEFDRRGGYTIEAEIGRVLYGLGFSMDDYGKRTEHFSGGWQMRIALARLLLQRPDLLLLDEPTNHLDLRATEWLEGYLRQYRGAVMVVSHDRYFLDLVATRTLDLRRGQIVEYPGNYSYYVKEKARRDREQASSYQRQQMYLTRQQAFIDRFHADKRRSSQTKSREKLLDKMEKVEAPQGKTKAIKFRFPASTPSGKKVFELREAGKEYGGKWVFQGCELLVERGDRVAMVGPNGSGKSTLLRLLAGMEKPDEGLVASGVNVLRAYYAQDQSETLDHANTVLEEMYGTAPKDWTLEDVRGMLGRFLFSGDDVYKQISVLSGGERSRLALAKMLLRPSNVLLLDEPTNHLDVAARETLEAALIEYPGTLVLASHDRYLIDKLANKVVDVEGGQVTLYSGNYTSYKEKKAALDTALAAAAAAEKETRRAQSSEPRTGRSGRRTQNSGQSPRRLQRDLEAVEREIIAVEEKIAELERLMSEPELFADPARSAPVVAEHTDLSTQLQQLNERWEELGNQLQESEQRERGAAV
jgi:ATP-binding cassette, subfamily F, member 3